MLDYLDVKEFDVNTANYRLLVTGSIDGCTSAPGPFGDFDKSYQKGCVHW